MSLFFSPSLPLSAVIYVLLEGESNSRRLCGCWRWPSCQALSPLGMQIKPNCWFLVGNTQDRRGDPAPVPLALGGWPRGAAANGWSGRPSKTLLLLLCPLQGKGPGVLPAVGSPCAQSPQGRVPRWQCRGAGPLPIGATERQRQAGRHACPGKHRQPAAPAPCLLPRGRQESKGQRRAGAQQEGLHTDSPSGQAVALPAHYRPIVINSEVNYSRKTYSGLPGALHHWGVLHHGTG